MGVRRRPRSASNDKIGPFFRIQRSEVGFLTAGLGLPHPKNLFEIFDPPSGGGWFVCMRYVRDTHAENQNRSVRHGIRIE